MTKLVDQKLQIVPFLKWAGGKRWFVETHADFLPQDFNHYYEPFIGGGSVFFHMQPRCATLADMNKDLISTYEALKNDWFSVQKALEQHQANHSDEYYYKLRSMKPRQLHTKAARFIYLNRTCWNGLYRVNLRGEFNVPRGTKDTVLLSTDDFESVSESLKNTELIISDFEDVIAKAQQNDFVFIDPPYTVKHNMNGFIKYNEKLFSWDDQVRLANAVKQASGRGAKVMVLNANHESICELYDGFDQIVLTRKSVLAAKSEYRGKYDELMIRCWDVKKEQMNEF
ncbi:Dam family site-specific DNA-(adenine-N6)-methyltransferase [Sulfurimonas diazotrophicus]|uniref:Site-specific DNA-methyltransferase (adenine-specific) n=1 Tax=Sulfurimonas diazotrophicus TaxID=3131939 RepID=A0ABZ3H6H1_9BACT